MPITLKVFREHVLIAAQVKRDLDAFGTFKIHEIQNLYPTHHASEGKAEGYYLFNWRNILVKELTQRGVLCGGMDIDVHGTGNTKSGIFNDRWTEGKSCYHHYLDVTSTNMYPYSFNVNGNALFWVHSKKERMDAYVAIKR